MNKLLIRKAIERSFEYGRIQTAVSALHLVPYLLSVVIVPRAASVKPSLVESSEQLGP
jgi:hypothetical protein